MRTSRTSKTSCRRGRSAARRAAVLASALATWLAAATAWAHPLLDSARERYEEADFAGALDTLARAEASSDLRREDLVSLYRQRALVHFAMGSEVEMHADLRRLASLEPTTPMPPEIPPGVREAFDQARARLAGPIRVQVETESMAGGLRVQARVDGDTTGLVREVRTFGRTAGVSWRSRVGTSLDVPATRGTNVEFYVEAIGPGGAVIAHSGTRETPSSAVVASAAIGGDDGATGVPVGGEDDSSTLWWVVGGSAVAVTAAVVVILLATSQESDQTQFGPPQIE